MELVFATKKVEEQCTSLRAAKRLFGGDGKLALQLHGRINALEQALNLKDIVVQPQFHFHKLLNKARKNYEGCYAIDIKSRTNPWRLILRPLDKDKQPLDSHSIDEMAATVEIVEIMEVSRHYE